DLGFCAPPLRIVASGRRLEFAALNRRGEVLLQLITPQFAEGEDYGNFERAPERLAFDVKPPEPVRFEEERTRQRSVFTALRRLLALFASDEDAHLGLYGAFGYELAFQFEPVRQRFARSAEGRDLVLYLPDSLLVVDHQRGVAQQHVYDFALTSDGSGPTTADLPRRVATTPFTPGTGTTGTRCDHRPGAYEAVVETAQQAFRRGELFEVVPGQTFSTDCQEQPSTLLRRLLEHILAP